MVKKSERSGNEKNVTHTLLLRITSETSSLPEFECLMNHARLPSRPLKFTSRGFTDQKVIFLQSNLGKRPEDWAQQVNCSTYVVLSLSLTQSSPECKIHLAVIGNLGRAILSVNRVTSQTVRDLRLYGSHQVCLELRMKIHEVQLLSSTLLHDFEVSVLGDVMST